MFYLEALLKNIPKSEPLEGKKMKFHFDSYVKNWKKKKPKTEEVDLFEEEKIEEKPEEKPEDKPENESKPEDGAEPDAKKQKVEIEDPEEEIEKLENFLKLMQEEEAGKNTKNPS